MPTHSCEIECNAAHQNPAIYLTTPGSASLFCGSMPYVAHSRASHVCTNRIFRTEQVDVSVSTKSEVSLFSAPPNSKLFRLASQAKCLTDSFPTGQPKGYHRIGMALGHTFELLTQCSWHTILIARCGKIRDGFASPSRKRDPRSKIQKIENASSV